MLTTLSTNPRAIKAYEKCGFKEFGCRHDALYRNGKYIDLIYMEIINEKTN
jgi:RimJ/RimL family protein N-acetyltransferase